MSIGMMPEIVFFLMRWAGRVVTQDALINSPWVITIGFTAFLVYFTLSRCYDEELPGSECWLRALLVGVVGMVAFFPFPLGILANVREIPDPWLRKVVYLVAGTKGVTWLYLLCLLARYYLFSNHRVFANLIYVYAYEEDEQLPECSGEDATEPEQVERKAVDAE